MRGGGTAGNGAVWLRGPLSARTHVLCAMRSRCAAVRTPPCIPLRFVWRVETSCIVGGRESDAACGMLHVLETTVLCADVVWG
jgi:hypothetical protein